MSSLSTTAGFARPPELFMICPTKKPFSFSRPPRNSSTWKLGVSRFGNEAHSQNAHLLWVFVDDLLYERLKRAGVRNLQQALRFDECTGAAAFLQERREDVFRNLRRASTPSGTGLASVHSSNHQPCR